MAWLFPQHYCIRLCTVATAALLAGSIACKPTTSIRANHDLRSGVLAGSNVLLVTIDTLRADRVNARVTPTLERLASTGIRFTAVHAHAPMTLPAHTSILTGLVPPHHGIRNNGSTALAAETPTLASLLHDTGYRTGAFVGAFVLDARFGLARGFDVYDDRVGSDTGPVTFAFAERTADRVTSLAGDWILSATDAVRLKPDTTDGSAPSPSRASSDTADALSRSSPQASVRLKPDATDVLTSSSPQVPVVSGFSRTPWFCWIHLFDPHAPYRAPEQRVPDPYDNEIAFTDAQIGKLFDRLRAAGQLDNTLIVVIADHGESLGEHGEATHGLFAYQATLHVPLIVAGRSTQPARIDAAVAQVDVLPTILDLLGIRGPERVDGQSLLPVMRGEAFSARPIYFEAMDAALTRNWAPLTGIVADGWKYIDLPDAELYELATDPGEQRNRLAAEASRGAAMAKRLSDWNGRGRSPAPAAPIDADAAARLRALGYTASQAQPKPHEPPTTADDPKRLIDLDRRYERALTLTGERNYGEAAALLQDVIHARPDFTVAYLNLASVFLAGGDPRRAVVLLEDAAKRGVMTPELTGRLGSAYLAAGDPRRAAGVLEPIARLDVPGGLEAMNTLAVALTQTGKYDRARHLLSDVLTRSPRSATTWSNLGLLELSAHRSSEAAQAFQHAVEADPRLGQAWEGLGAARAASDRPGAVDAWKHAVDLEPRNFDVLFNLVVVLRELGRNEEARPYMERFVREAPQERYAPDIANMRSWMR